jgi:hypothetical protein
MGARQQLLREPLTEAALVKELHRLLPRRNNYCVVNYPELLEELRHFGVKNRQALRALVLRNIREAVRIGREPLDSINARIYRKEFGDEKFLFLERRQSSSVGRGLCASFWSWNSEIAVVSLQTAATTYFLLSRFMHNKQIEFAPFGRPTRKQLCCLLAAHSRR